MSLAFDEFGKPYIIVREQTTKKRTKGLDALKVNIIAARTVANSLKTSLGPKGMDKMITSPDGDVLVTNDGATIVEKMEIVHPTASLLVELSQSQDNEIGDGTTGVVVFAGALLDQSLLLLEKGIHPLKIASGFDKACDMALQRLEQISKPVDIYEDNHENLVRTAMTALGSKIVSKYKRQLAEIAVKAVLSIADLERKDVNFDLIKITTKTGGSINDTSFVNGIVIDKDWSHPQMVKEVVDAKICILTCPFEPPKPKNKYTLNITSAKDYEELKKKEEEYFKNMVELVKQSGANVAMCQWGFDDEANHLLLQNNLPAVRWVSGTDIELLAIATGGRIVPRFSELTPEKLGKAGRVKEIEFGTMNERMLVIEELAGSKAVTILVRGSSKMIVDESKRSIHDALCVIRNLIKDSNTIVGGGACELNCAIHLKKQADNTPGVEQYAIRAFGEALEQIPLALADNSGLAPLLTLSEARAQQIQNNSHVYGVDCLGAKIGNMEEINVFETLLSKKQQFELATQVVKMILKIDDVIEKDQMAEMMQQQGY